MGVPLVLVVNAWLMLPSLRGRAGLIAIVLLLQAGCGGKAEPPPADAAALDGGSATAFGTFLVRLVPAMLGAGGNEIAAAYTSIFGKVYDGPVPSATAWTVVEEAQGCQLLTPRVPFCAAGCGGTAICVEDGQCAPYPSAHDVGRVHVTGLGAAAFDMEPIAGNYQPPVGVALPYPPCPEGTPVQMAAPGGPLGTLALASRGIAPLVFEQTPMPATGQPLRLTWTPPGQPDLTRMEVKLDISHHGGAKGKIECNVPDTGSLEIPAAQVSKLIALGVAGFPTIVLSRVAEGTTAVGAGAVTLQILSTVERAVEIEGLRSCTANNQCPAGTSCQSDLTCK